MKIEKLTDRQIRCYISADDLSARSIRMSELMYGSEKVKKLFTEVLNEAERQLNFDTSDIPLVIEAIPMPDGTIIMQITKVEDPEELDSRFARFSPMIEDGEEYSDGEAEREELLTSFADGILKAMQSIGKAAGSSEGEAEELPDVQESSTPALFFRVFRFASLDEVGEAGRAVSGLYNGINSLFKDPDNGTYLLVVHAGSVSAEDFNRVCNRLSEYAPGVRSNSGTAAYYDEHYPLILKDHALQSMKKL